MRPLTQDEFRDALRKGMGRAVLHVREHGTAGVEEDILHACLNSLGYDPQCEGTRGEWLWEILGEADMKMTVRPKVLKALLDQPADADTWTVAQLFTLVLLYAKDGDQEARRILYEKFDRQEYNESWLGGTEIISLDGLQGLLHVAKVVGQNLIKDPANWEDDCLLTLARDRLGESAVSTALAEQAEKDEEIRAFVSQMECQQAKQEVRTERPLESLGTVLTHIEQAKDMGYWLRRWGRRATQEDVDAVFSAMLKETRLPQLAEYLRVFWSRQMPFLPPSVLDLIGSPDQDAVYAVARALQNVKDHGIRIRVLQALHQTPPQLLAARMLAKNYEPGDHQLLEASLPEQGEEWVFHDFGLSILRTAEEVHDPLLSKCLVWVYEKGPCSECRRDALLQLIGLRRAPMDMLNECLCDCSGEARQAASAALGLSPESDDPKSKLGETGGA